jgi:hypothetical protein
MNKQTILFILLIIFYGLTDTVTGIIMIHKSPLLEANPASLMIYQSFGYAGAILMKATFILIIGLLVYCIKNKVISESIMIVVIVAGFGCTIGNIVNTL